jgi:hypothetical protein
MLDQIHKQIVSARKSRELLLPQEQRPVKPETACRKARITPNAVLESDQLASFLHSARPVPA